MKIDVHGDGWRLRVFPVDYFWINSWLRFLIVKPGKLEGCVLFTLMHELLAVITVKWFGMFCYRRNTLLIVENADEPFRQISVTEWPGLCAFCARLVFSLSSQTGMTLGNLNFMVANWFFFKCCIRFCFWFHVEWDVHKVIPMNIYLSIPMHLGKLILQYSNSYANVTDANKQSWA